MVDVVNEQIERPNALNEPAFDAVPLVGRNEPGNWVEWDDSFDPLVAAVNRERDPLMAHHQVGRAVAAGDLVDSQVPEPLIEGGVVRARLIGRGEHFVETGQRIAVKERRFGFGSHGYRETPFAEGNPIRRTSTIT